MSENNPIDVLDGDDIKQALVKLSNDPEWVENSSAKDIYREIMNLNTKTEDGEIIPEGYLSPEEVMKLVDMITSVNKKYNKHYNSKELKSMSTWDFFLMTSKYKDDKGGQ